ncbi:hypothetical protein [Haladaptatus sp. CMAA 1911]|uniref:hypothetical protein n=1 Tax=unclassified Haladaptatus TaxID=2622732 RepID=UPI003754C0A2
MVPDENTGREAEEGRATGGEADDASRSEERHEGRSHEERRHEGESHEERPHPPAGSARYEGRRPPEGEFERPVGSSSYRGRYGSRIPKHEREENDEGGREIEVRKSEAESKGERKEEEETRKEETGEIPKYGGPRDPEWKRRRQLVRERTEQRRRQRDDEIRQYEWRTDAALTRQGDLQVEKGGRRYHRGRR